MYNSIKLTLYTQEDCYYCFEMKKKLVEWGYDFREINLSHDLFAKDFLKENSKFIKPDIKRSNKRKKNSNVLTDSLNIKP